MPTINELLSYTDLGSGQYQFANFSDRPQEVTISYMVQTLVPSVSALGQLGLSLSTGGIDQPVWSWLQNYTPSQALAYSGAAYVYADSYDLTNQAEVENHSFEVVSGHGVGGEVLDAWPDVILRDFLVTASGSVGWVAGRLASLQPLTNYLRARQLWLSVAMTEQKPARDWLQGLADICNSQWTWQGGQLDLVPRGDETITSSYGTFTPVITPVFDLVHAEGGDLLDAVEIEPVVNEDAHNIIKIEWTNRTNAYAIEVMTASDQAHIELFGQRPASVVPMHAIHTADVASSVAQQMLQREMTVWNKYRFKVPFSRALLGLMDLVTLTDADSALDRVPVRIISRSESGSMEYTYEAEDAPIGSATAPLYGAQGGSGFAHDYNAVAGPVAAPNMFEAPTELTATGLEVYAAVSGQPGPAGQYWGGCTVYVSLDGLAYKSQGRLYGGARYGQLTAPMGTTGNAAVLLAGRGGQLLSGSAEDAAALSTLCWADGPQGGEYFSYQTATLTAPNAYTLSGLVRGAYRNPVAAHTSGTAFVRVDSALAKSGPLTSEMLGKKIYFKFASFNVYGGSEQALGDVVEYSYTITGEQLKQPPPDVPTFLASGKSLSWGAVQAPDLAGYEVRFHYGQNTAWGTAQPLHIGLVTESPWTPDITPPGQVTLMVKAQDTTGNQSTKAAVIVANLGDVIVDNLILTYDDKAAGFPGVKIGCAVSGGNLLANDSGGLFWGVDNANFWTGDTSPFWKAASYMALDYTTGYTIQPSEAGSRLTLNTAIAGESYLLQYRFDASGLFWGNDANFFWSNDAAPFWSQPGVWQAWPGELNNVPVGRIEFRVFTQAGPTRGMVTEFTLNFDVVDEVEEFNDLVISAAGTRLPVTKLYRSINNVSLTLQNSGTAVTAKTIDKLSTGPLVACFDSAGVQVAGLLDARIQGVKG